MKRTLSTIGWMISWLAIVDIPLVETTTCTQGSTDAWLVSLLLYTPIAAVGLVLLHLGRESSRTTRWLAAPHAVLVPFAALTALRYLWYSSFVGNHLCVIATREVGFTSEPQQWWNPLWAPVQLAVVAAVCAMIWLYWHVTSTVRTPANQPLHPTAARGGYGGTVASRFRGRG